MTDRYKVLLSPKALRGLVKAHVHISANSAGAAADMIGRILDAIDLLAMFPHRRVVQQRHPKPGAPIRMLPVNPYLIFFRVVEKKRAVNILEIRRGARRRPKHLSDTI